MSGLNKEEFEEFIKECNDGYEKDILFLIKHGWKKKNNDDDCILWISPKGEEYGHHHGFFMSKDERLAIDVAKHDVVLESFGQFQIQLFEEDDEEPSDFIFPCIKDGKIYHYIEALSIAVYNVQDYELKEWPHWPRDNVLDVIKNIQIKHGDLIKIKILENSKFQLIGVS